MVFSTKNLHYYLISVGVIFTASYFANKMKQPFETNDEYEMIRNYVLNDSPLYGYNRPKLWIHSKYQVNSRKWKSFGSRNSTDLNQPYLHLVIQSIIDKCGNDFHICLIDDESFSKLIPSWDADITNMAEPHKQLFRELAMMKVVYHYGGMVVPNSFLCMQNLKPIYDKQMLENKPFVCEAPNKSHNMLTHTKQPLFSASTYIMGAPKNDDTVSSIVSYLENRNARSHFTDEYQFKNDLATFLSTLTNTKQVDLIDGTLVGVKSSVGKPILLDHLMEQQPLSLNPDCVGLYIPSEEILSRTKYQWFAALSEDSVLEAECALTTIMLESVSTHQLPSRQGDIHRSIAAI